MLNEPSRDSLLKVKRRGAFIPGSGTLKLTLTRVLHTSLSTIVGMAPSKAQRNPSEEDDDDRSSDEDFNPTAPNPADSDESEDDEPLTIPIQDPAPASNASIAKSNKGPRAYQRPVAASRPVRKRAASAVSLDSGDEVTIQEGRKKSKKRKKNDKQGAHAAQDDDDDDDEGGEGGWVKTRSQRRTEGNESRPLATTEGATEDIGAIMQRLEALPVINLDYDGAALTSQTKAIDEADYITIKRTTHFAGKTETEEKRVHKDSAEARLFLKEQESKAQAQQKAVVHVEQEKVDDNELSMLPVRRPTLTPSRFDPNPAALYYPAPWRPNFSGLLGNSLAGANKQNMPPPRHPTATKLNTVDKSRLDWVGYVDKAGIAQELDEYGKSKQSYLQRRDFLSRTENRIEDERREGRRKNVVASA